MKPFIRLACPIFAMSMCFAQDPGKPGTSADPNSSAPKGNVMTLTEPQSLNGIQSIAGSLIQGLDKVQKDASKKTSNIVKRTEELLDRQEKQAKRFDRILDTWERQQAQYQKYLDSLEKK